MTRTIRTAAMTAAVLAVLALAACQSGITGQQIVAATADTGSVQAGPVSGLPAPGGSTGGADNTPVQGIGSSAEQTRTSGSESTGSAVSASPDGPTVVESVATTTDVDVDGGHGAGSGTGAGSGSSGGGSNSDSGSGHSTSPEPRKPRFVSASAGCVLDGTDGTYHLIVNWELADATGMALSVDNPGLVGSYGTYSWHGSQDLSTLGCYTEDRTQDIDLYSVGGVGHRVKKSFHIHEDHHRIAPPPFGGGVQPITTPATTTTAPTTTTSTGTTSTSTTSTP